MVKKAAQAVQAPVSTSSLRECDEQVLVEAAKNGDGSAFSELCRRYRPRIYALALHMTGNKSEAEDITQDTFVSAYSKLDAFEGRSRFYTWVYRIAVHRTLNLKRYQKRRKGVDFDDPRVEAAIEVDAGGDPRRALELQDVYAQLIASFDQLSPLLRTTVVLTTLQGMSYAEAADVLDTSEGTVAWRIHEARKRLRDELQRLQKEPTPIAVQLEARQVTEAHQRAGYEGALRVLIPRLLGSN